MITPLKQIAPLTRGETTDLVEAMVSGTIHGAVSGPDTPMDQRADAIRAHWRRAAREAVKPFPMHLVEKLDGDFGFMIGTTTSTMSMNYQPANPDGAMRLAGYMDVVATALPEDHFMAALLTKCSLILRRIQAEQETALEEVDAMTRAGRGT